MVEHSAGILLFRYEEEGLRILLVHPGGPFWKRRDEGSWSIPKGLLEEDEDPLHAARREFREETGHKVEGAPIELGEIRQPGGKVVHAWAVEEELDTENIESNTFRMEWPKNSGNVKEFPEVDRAEWFDVETAKMKILKGQKVLIDRLLDKVRSSQKGRTR
ncbi:MAG: NUDIX domain-containing protein [Thermoplasmatota archaeon]